MMNRQSAALCGALLAALVVSINSLPADGSLAGREQPTEALEGALQAAQAAPQQDESYQRIYEAFTKLVQNVNNNSLGNARRLVTRLNQLVGGGSGAGESAAKPAKPAPVEQAAKPQQQLTNKLQTEDEAKTDQILNRLDQVTKDTDQHTLRQLNDDVNRLVGTLSESYLRNIRRVIERINRTIGAPAPALHQSADRLEEAPGRQPGFPGWDELIVAVDRMQKSLANFVRSSTKLITAG